MGLVAGEAAFQAGTGEPWLGGAWLSGAAVLAAVVAWRLWATATWRAGGLALALGLFGAVLGASAWRHFRLSLAPERVAAEAVQAATGRRDADLAGAIATARRVAGLALQRVGGAVPGRAPSLSDLLSGGSVEMGLLVSAGDTVVAVAGPQRVAPLDAGTTAAVVHDPFVRLLVVVEQRGDRRAQVNLLLDASAALPAPGRSLAEVSRGWQGVGWTWNAGTGITTYATATLAADAVRQVMVPEDPGIDLLRIGQLERSRWFVVGAVAAVAVIVLGAGAPPLVRAGALIIPLWVAMRSGLLLTSASGSTTIALLAGAALMLIAVVLWRRQPHRTPVGMAAAAILLAVSPVLVAAAARNSVPEMETLTLPGWFAWQAMLALAATGYLALASAPLLSLNDGAASRRWGWIATGVAVLLGLIGIVAWRPDAGSGWPAWYSVAWTLPFAAMVPVTRPDARRLSILTTAAIVAALSAWNVSLRQRMNLASADLDRLGSDSDSVTVAALGALAQQIRAGNSTRLDRFYGIWRGSDVAAEGIPTQLALWADTTVIAWVALDSLAPSWGDLQAAVRETGPSIGMVSLARGEGRHTVMVVPLDGDTVATVLA
ncbi:MAG TPA: hypothetical protein PLL69_04020, partial [Gemmatimonadales bacterium]|nr:hypothetical protein [Gemmatimonadales bacterium]